MGRRIEIESDHVPELFLKVRIVRQLERLHDMRLQAILRPDTLHGAVRYTGVAAHAAHAPTLAVLRRTRHFGNDTLDFLLWNRRLASATDLVIKSGEAMRFEATGPCPHRGHRCLQLLGDTLDLQSFQTQKDDVRSEAVPMLRCNSARTSALAVITLTGRAIPELL